MRQCQPSVLDLIIHNLSKIELLSDQKDGHDRSPHRNFVRNDLRRRTNPSEKRILRVGRPTGQNNAVHAEGNHCEDKKQTYIQIRYHPTNLESLYGSGIPMKMTRDPLRYRTKIESRAKWNHRHRYQGGNHRQNGGEIEIDPIHACGNELLLEKKLRGIRQALSESKNPNIGERNSHPIWPPPILNPCTESTFSGHASRNHG